MQTMQTITTIEQLDAVLAAYRAGRSGALYARDPDTDEETDVEIPARRRIILMRDRQRTLPQHVEPGDDNLVPGTDAAGLRAALEAAGLTIDVEYDVETMSPDERAAWGDVAAWWTVTLPSRVRRLTLHTSRRAQALEALTAACAPYGSLVAEVPALMLEWSSGAHPDDVNYSTHPPHQLDTAHRLFAAIRGVDCAQTSSLTLGDFRAAVETPTSGTTIEIYRDSSGWTVDIDFGSHGSHRRADGLCDLDLPWGVEYVGVAS